MFIVKTETGFVGRRSMTGRLTADNPEAFAYLWESEMTANLLATSLFKLAAGEYEVLVV